MKFQQRFRDGLIHGGIVEAAALLLPGQVEASYIQLWNQKLTLNSLNTIDWD